MPVLGLYLAAVIAALIMGGIGVLIEFGLLDGFMPGAGPSNSWPRMRSS